MTEESPQEPRKKLPGIQKSTVPVDQPEKILSEQVSLTTGKSASVQDVLPVITSLLHLERNDPELLTAFRAACIQSGSIRGYVEDAEQVQMLETLGLTAKKGLLIDDVCNIVLATVRGPLGKESLENPFVDEMSRTMLDYLLLSVKMSMAYEPHELKAMHENPIVKALSGAEDHDKWTGYVRKRQQHPGPNPDRN